MFVLQKCVLEYHQAMSLVPPSTIRNIKSVHNQVDAINRSLMNFYPDIFSYPADSGDMPVEYVKIERT